MNDHILIFYCKFFRLTVAQASHMLCPGPLLLTIIDVTMNQQFPICVPDCFETYFKQMMFPRAGIGMVRLYSNDHV